MPDKTGGGGTLDSQNPPRSISSKDSKPFELAQSLEVAEHLYQEYAPNFVKLLTSLSDVVLFSAAIPYQGGVHHVNEQPPAYWAELFAKEGYVCIDCLRERIWEDDSISTWYRQNIMIFVHESKTDLFAFAPVEFPSYLVHYRAWEDHGKWLESLVRAHDRTPIRTGIKLLLKGTLMQLHLWDLAQKLRGKR